jgi:hypothetical protein
MLNQGIKVILFLTVLFLFSCSLTETDKTHKFKNKSLSIIGKNEYTKIYNQASDSIVIWSTNNLSYYQYLGVSKKYLLDSLLCFNKAADRFITCILMQQQLKEGVADDIDFFYGEKINNKWYFFKGANVFLPRSAYNKDIHTPMIFPQLHEIALTEVYSGYLKSNGEINEEWFTSHFENVGFCSECKTRADFQKTILQGVGALWTQRDTTQPIKHLNKNPLP